MYSPKRNTMSLPLCGMHNIVKLRVYTHVVKMVHIESGHNTGVLAVCSMQLKNIQADLDL